MSVHTEVFVYLKNVPWFDLLKFFVFRLLSLTLCHLGIGVFFACFFLLISLLNMCVFKMWLDMELENLT